MLALGLAVLALMPIAIYLAQQARTKKPGLRWPVFASILKLQYLPDPPRIQGLWNGRRVAVEAAGETTRVSTFLPKPSRLRVEIGPRADVERRAGILVPDPVATGDTEFEDSYLSRCSDKAAGLRIMDQTLRRRVLGQGRLDLLGQAGAVQATIPPVKDVDTLESLLEIESVVAGEMEAFG